MIVEVLSPEENMGRDLESFLRVEGGGESSFRLYRWDRLCISLGYFQREKTEVRLSTVRRPTGGGALLHGWDISFSIADLKESWGGKPSKIYAKVSDIFIKIFKEFGAAPKLERFRGRYLGRFYCFWVPTLGELSLGGRKVLSMAMRTGKRAFLIHGSIYIDFDYEHASRLLGVPKELLRERIVSLRELGIEESIFLKVLHQELNSLQSCRAK